MLLIKETAMTVLKQTGNWVIDSNVKQQPALSFYLACYVYFRPHKVF